MKNINIELFTHVSYLLIMIVLNVFNIINKNYLGLSICSVSAIYWLWCIKTDIKEIKTR